MAYGAEINRENPTCIVFLVDQSKSMALPFGKQPEKKKADGVADAINRLLQTLCINCARADGLHEYFQIGVIGYGRTVLSAFGDRFGGQGLVPIGQISRHPLRIETRSKLMDDGAGGVFKRDLKFPVWFDPVAAGKTPMRQAIELAARSVSAFLAEHPRCYPPLVINITDGQADDDPGPAAAELRGLASADGQVLLFNAHLSERNDPPVRFPQTDAGLPNDFARRLFGMSSVLPPKAVQAVLQVDRDLADHDEGESSGVGPESRGFVFNADLVEMVQFLDIGTKSALGAVRR
jgi:hypothetical protein